MHTHASVSSQMRCCQKGALTSHDVYPVDPGDGGIGEQRVDEVVVQRPPLRVAVHAETDQDPRVRGFEGPDKRGHHLGLALFDLVLGVDVDAAQPRVLLAPGRHLVGHGNGVVDRGRPLPLGAPVLAADREHDRLLVRGGELRQRGGEALRDGHRAGVDEAQEQQVGGRGEEGGRRPAAGAVVVLLASSSDGIVSHEGEGGRVCLLHSR